MTKDPKDIFSNFLQSVKKRRLLQIVLTVVLIPVLFTTFYIYYFENRIYPRIYVGNIKVSGLKEYQAQELLSSELSTPNKLSLTISNSDFEIDLKEINFKYDNVSSAKMAFDIYHSPLLTKKIAYSLYALLNNTNLEPMYSYDHDQLEEYIFIISDQVEEEPIYPKAELANGDILIDAGKPGKVINKNKLIFDIENAFTTHNFNPIEIHLTAHNPSLSETQKVEFQDRVEKLLGKNITLTFEYLKFELPDSKLIKIASPYEPGVSADAFDNILGEIKNDVEREAQSASFVYQNQKVEEFTPAKDGVIIDKVELLKKLAHTYNNLSQSKDVTSEEIEIPVRRTTPEITIDKVNNLGINELLGRGTSRFDHSIASREFNINHASSKFNGVLVPPGEVFSFNNTLGDVSSLTGYKQAYVIRDGMTVLGDGGGVCQVSTTLFRAVLDAGLPIVERRAHSYRVSYYEQGSPPGLDATVYAPTTDLKFKNDTPGHLLIQTEIDLENNFLVFEIYGTSDGRIATTSEPIVLSSSPPPEDLYIDDSDLPAGEIRQIDYSAWGAKVSFDYLVERNGEIIYEKTFFSNYRPWQAKFLRGVGQPQ